MSDQPTLHSKRLPQGPFHVNDALPELPGRVQKWGVFRELEWYGPLRQEGEAARQAGAAKRPDRFRSPP